MPLTLLLDLDDTLLSTNINDFVPAYSQALAKTLAPYVPAEAMMPAFWGGTKRMMESTDPSISLVNVFYNYFSQKSGFDLRSIRPVLENFYDEVFPTLENLTQPISYLEGSGRSRKQECRGMAPVAPEPTPFRSTPPSAAGLFTPSALVQLDAPLPPSTLPSPMCPVRNSEAGLALSQERFPSVFHPS